MDFNILDEPITAEEVKFHLSKGKSGKAPGIDGIVLELLRCF